MELSIEPELQLLSPLPVCIDPRNGCKWGSSGCKSAEEGRRSEGGASSTMLQSYTEETPGLRLSPNVVLIMSIGFIAFVGILHVLGKLPLVPRSS